MCSFSCKLLSQPDLKDTKFPNLEIVNLYEIYDTDKEEIDLLSQKVVALTELKLEVCSFYASPLLDCCNKLTKLCLLGKDILIIMECLIIEILFFKG